MTETTSTLTPALARRMAATVDKGNASRIAAVRLAPEGTGARALAREVTIDGIPVMSHPAWQNAINGLALLTRVGLADDTSLYGLAYNAAGNAWKFLRDTEARDMTSDAFRALVADAFARKADGARGDRHDRRAPADKGDRQAPAASGDGAASAGAEALALLRQVSAILASSDVSAEWRDIASAAASVLSAAQAVGKRTPKLVAAA